MMLMYACSAFNMKPDEYKSLSLEDQIRYFTMAEQIAGQKLDVEGVLQEQPDEPPVPESMTSIDFVNDPNIADVPEF